MKKNKTTYIMSSVLMLLFAVLFSTLLGRFLFIQGTGEVAGISLHEWADEKRTNSYTIEAERGKILDRNGMPLAYDRTVYRLSAVVDEAYSVGFEEPKHVADIQETAEQIAPLLDIDVSKAAEIMSNGQEEGKFQVEFGSEGKELSQEKKEEIEALNLPGIQFTPKSKRYYPNGVFASRVLGLTKTKEATITGITGIEMEKNDVLSGKDGHISYQRDKYNVKLLDPNQVIKPAQNGQDVYLTIDQKIQTLLEDSMSQVMKEYEPERINAIVMDPKTGEILAMSNRPSYDPNQIGEVSNWYNDIISTPFEPGSTMKIFTLAAAIEEGAFDPKETFQSGSYKIDEINRAVRDHKREGWGKITYKEGIQRSSNVAASKLVWEKMGPKTFLDYLKAFHFDQETGIDLPGEQKGKILYNWPIEQLTTSYGQGTTLTPIQQMMAATAIANDGKMMRPFVIAGVKDPETGDLTKETKPEVTGKPISPETASKTREILGTVVSEEEGTGYDIYNLNDYSVAGKTGTAEIPNPDGRGYLYGHGNYIYSFLGMAPKEDPELIMYVSVKQPKLESEPGSAPVSFIFKNVMENSLHYLNINPDREVAADIKPIDITGIVGKSVKTADQELKDKGLVTSVIGSEGKVQAIEPDDDKELLPGERVLLLTDKPEMPDLTGWSQRDVLKLGALLDMEVKTMGTGFAEKQSIKPGASLAEKDYLVVEFAAQSDDETKPATEEGAEAQAEQRVESGQ